MFHSLIIQNTSLNNKLNEIGLFYGSREKWARICHVCKLNNGGKTLAGVYIFVHSIVKVYIVFLILFLAIGHLLFSDFNLIYGLC